MLWTCSSKFRRNSACCLIIDLVVVGSDLTTADEWSATPSLGITAGLLVVR
jgi:hypothetical protein